MGFFNLWKKNDNVAPLEKTSCSPIAPETLLVRSNKYIPDPEEEDDDDDSTPYEKNTIDLDGDTDGGREVRYETNILVSPVMVSKRKSSSAKALKTKRVLLTKDDVEDLSAMLKGMALKNNDNKEEKTVGEDDENECDSKPECIPSMESYATPEKNKKKVTASLPEESQYGRFSKTVLSPDSKLVRVTRSHRLSTP